MHNAGNAFRGLMPFFKIYSNSSDSKNLTESFFRGDFYFLIMTKMCLGVSWARAGFVTAGC